MADLGNVGEFAQTVLRDARKIILEHYYTDIDVQRKEDDSPVTLADRQTEMFIREQIHNVFPDHGIIGEEFEDVNPKARFKWVIDPIDGTKSFISKTPLFGSLLALLENDEPILGALYLPVQDEMIIGDNKNTFLNGNKIEINQNVSLNEATILTTDYRDFSMYKSRAGFDRLVERCRLTRTWGDCYGYYLLCINKAQVMIDPAMSVWDKLALIPIIRGAGGVITDYYGEDPIAGDSIVASASNLHDLIIETLNADS
ncbi:MAG: inositol monophosphatase family protein [Leptospirales bacterium]